MPQRIEFTPKGDREFRKLSLPIQKRIKEKLEWYAAQENPLRWAKPLVDLLPPATHRFRIGGWRVSFYLERDAIVVDAAEIKGRAYRH